MISQILNMLATAEHFGVSDRVEIAKGKNELPDSWKDVWYKIKRHFYGRT